MKRRNGLRDTLSDVIHERFHACSDVVRASGGDNVLLSAGADGAEEHSGIKSLPAGVGSH